MHEPRPSRLFRRPPGSDVLIASLAFAVGVLGCAANGRGADTQGRAGQRQQDAAPSATADGRPRTGASVGTSGSAQAGQPNDNNRSRPAVGLAEDPLSRLIALATLEQSTETPRPGSPAARAADDARMLLVAEAADLTAPDPGTLPVWAKEPLEEIVRQVIASHPRPRSGITVGEPADTNWRQAARLFLSGREARLEGQPQQALADLTEAKRLHPGSEAILSELARTQEMLGQHDESRQTWRLLLSIDPDHREGLLHIGIAAAEAGETEAAIAALARAAGLPAFWGIEDAGPQATGKGDAGEDKADDGPEGADRDADVPGPAEQLAIEAGADNATVMLIEAMQEPVQIVALAELATLLAEARADAAAIEAFEAVGPLARQDLALTAGPIEDEISRLVRQRGDLDRRLGDAWYRAGEFAKAADAWTRAVQEPMIDREAVIPRLVAIERRLGRPATAILTALRALAEVHQTDRIVHLLARLAEREHGDLLREVVTSLASGEPDVLRYVEVATVVGSTEDGFRRWEDHLQREPLARDAWPQALRWAFFHAGAADEAAAARLAVRLLMQFPAEVERGGATLAGTLVDLSGNPRALRAAIAAERRALGANSTTGRRDPAANEAAIAADLLDIYLMLLTGERLEARQAATNLASRYPGRVDTELAAITVLGESGEDDLARSRLNRLTRNRAETILAEPAWVYQVSGMLLELGDPENALAWMNRLESAVAATSGATTDRDASDGAATEGGEDDGAAGPAEARDRTASADVAPAVTVRGFDPITHSRRKAQLAISLNRPETAESILLQTLSRFPESEPIYQALLTLYSASGVQANTARRDDLRRLLDRYLPSSRVRRLMHAQNEVERGRPRSAARTLTRLAEEDPADSVSAVAAVGQWIRAGEAEFALGWASNRLADRAGDLSLRLARLDALLALERYEETLLAIDAIPPHQADDTSVLRRQRTALEGLGRTDEANALARQMIEAEPPSTERDLRLAVMALESGNASLAIEDLEEAYARGDSAFWSNLELALSLARSAAEADPDDGAAAHSFIERVVLEAIRDEHTISAAAGLMLVDAMLQLKRPIDDISETLATLRSLHPDRAGEMTALVLSGLAEYQRLDDAIAIVDGWLELTDAPNPRGGLSRVSIGRDDLEDIDFELIRWRLLQAARRDEPQVVIGLVDVLEDLDRLDAVEFAVDRESADLLAPTAAQAVYLLSQLFDGAGHEASAEALLVDVLRRQPDHAMAANNLGYRFVERGDRLAEAERLLRMAVRQVPESPAVLDSLGWLRYRNGVFERPGIDGDDRRLDEWGAVALLQRAVDLSGSGAGQGDAAPTGNAASSTTRPGTTTNTDPTAGMGDPTLLDHLGDALWRAGRTEEAREVWTRIGDLRQTLLDRTAAADPDLRELIDAEWQEVAERAERKADAVARGERPAVAPLVEESADAAALPSASAGGRDR